MENVYNFSVQRQNSCDVPLGKSPCVKIKFIKDENFKHQSPSESKLGEAEDYSPQVINPLENRVQESEAELSLVLWELHRSLERRDKRGIFARPVTEVQAPNYCSIVERPMDLETIGANILRRRHYGSVLDMFDEAVLMCQNAMVYNTAETVYYKMAGQMLNFSRRLFSADSLNRIAESVLTRSLSHTEMGDVACGIRYIRSLQLHAARIRPGHTLPRRVYQELLSYRTKESLTTEQNLGCHTSSGTRASKMAVAAMTTNAVVSDCSPDSTTNGGQEVAMSTSVSSSEDGDDEEGQLDEQCIPNDHHDPDSDVRENQQAKEAVLELARSRLTRACGPVVYLDSCSSDSTVTMVDCVTGHRVPLSAGFAGMVMDLRSVDIEAAINEGVVGPIRSHQLCYDRNEAVTLNNSRPLQDYCHAEQAVLVETFGDVVMAEYAYNMHKFVPDLLIGQANPVAEPVIGPSAGMKLLRQRLNCATKYVDYKVDLIISKVKPS